MIHVETVKELEVPSLTAKPCDKTTYCELALLSRRLVPVRLPPFGRLVFQPFPEYS